MATEIPPASEFAGLTRNVIAYSEAFEALVAVSKTRELTEAGNVVVLELEERNSQGGKTDIANTVTIYAFNGAGDLGGKLTNLDVYVAHLRTQAA